MNLLKIFRIVSFNLLCVKNYHSMDLNKNVIERLNIKHNDLPTCVECKFFKPVILPGDSKINFPLSLCSQFGIKNLVSGEIKYQYADICRETEKLCGKEGKYFIQKINEK